MNSACFEHKPHGTESSLCPCVPDLLADVELSCPGCNVTYLGCSAVSSPWILVTRTKLACQAHLDVLYDRDSRASPDRMAPAITTILKAVIARAHVKLVFAGEVRPSEKPRTRPIGVGGE